MADQFLQTAEGSGTTTAAASLTGVATGSTLIAFLCDGSSGSAPATQTVNDGAAYTGGASAIDASNAVWCRVFYRENVASGNYTITGTIDSGQACYIRVVEVGGSGVGSVIASGTNAGFQSGPGTGANALTSGSCAVSGSATVVGFSTDSASVSPANEPNVDTGFTTRANNANGTIGAFRLESGAFAANQAATFTAITGTDNYVTAGIAVTNGAGGGAGGNVPQTWQQRGGMGVMVSM